jgi:PAS domain S-box-containing protein
VQPTTVGWNPGDDPGRMADGFFALDLQWRIVYMSAEARRLLRVGSVDPTGREFFDVFVPLRGTLFEDEYRRATREAQAIRFVELCTISQRPLQVDVYPSQDGLAVYLRDAPTQHTLVTEAIERMTDGFAAYDNDLNLRYANHRLAEFHGMTPASMMGRNASEFVNKPGNLQYFKEAIETQREVTYETYDPVNDRWFDVRIYPTPDGVSLYSRNVTERKIVELQIKDVNVELERRVAERTLQLEQANRELESFALSVSHDLRAPLRAIDGFGQALEEDVAGSLSDTAQGHLTRVRKATKRMVQLIDSLLEFARVAQTPISYSTVDLSQIVVSIAADLQDVERDRQVTFEIADGLVALGEPMLLRAVLENLVNNAWKFTRRVAHAKIVFDRSDAAEFFVRDNGAGFDMAYAKKLFDAFQRLHSTDEFEGTGVGLATVARIIRRHGGAIRAESAVGKGATFYFTLPAMVAAITPS